jgi:hypothetical protein
MLAESLLGVRSKRVAGDWMARVKVDGVQLVIAHHSMSFACVDETANSSDDTRIFGASIDEITKKDNFFIWLSGFPAGAMPLPANMVQKSLELVGMSMNIWNDYILHNAPPLNGTIYGYRARTDEESKTGRQAVERTQRD